MRAAGDHKLLAAGAQDSERTKPKVHEPKTSPQDRPNQGDPVPQPDGAEVPIPKTPQGPRIDSPAEPAQRDVQDEPAQPVEQLRTPRPAWADVADDDLRRDGPLPAPRAIANIFLMQMQVAS